MFDNYQYNRSLKDNANSLRKSMTKAQACLWKYVLKNKQFKGYQFRRERPVLKYIADFMCIPLKMIIEVDGITHHFEEVNEKDKERQKNLEANGFVVIRFTDEEILKNIEGVRQYLENLVNEIEYTSPPPAPASGGQADS